MSACKLGTTPVNRLSEEQCDRMIKRSWKYIWKRYSKRDYLSIMDRIQQYKDNLKHRNLK